MKTIKKYQWGKPIRPQVDLSLLAPNGEVMAQHASNIDYLVNQEKEAYEADISQPYYQIHEKPTFEEWKQQNQTRWQNQATVRPAENVSAPVSAVNQYVRQFKHDMANGKVPKGKYTLPAAALASLGLAGFAAAPVTFIAGGAGAEVGGKIFDSGTKFVTGKSWADKVHDWTGLDTEAAAMTNPGMWVGGLAPFATRGSRTLLSAGDQIVKDAAKDVFHYGPVAIMKNPKGWYRPYVDQVRNGWQGWKDAKTILPDQSKGIFKGFQSGEPIEELERFVLQRHPVSEYTTSNPQYHDILSIDGSNIYYRTNLEGTPLWGVTQNSNEPNTFMFHIAGDKYFKLGRAEKLDIHKAMESLPKESYVSDLPEENLITGQIGMNFARKNGRTPTLGEMIKASKMKSEVVEPYPIRGFDNISETPLSSSSMRELLSRGTNPKRPWDLRYANGYMPHFNSQSLTPELHPNNFPFMPKQERLQLATDFVRKFPGARKPFIGLDGKLKISIPVNKKSN